MLLLGLELGVAVASDSCDGTAHGTSDAVCDAGAQVVKLALGLLGLATGILLATLLLEVLVVRVSQALWGIGMEGGERGK